MTSKCACGSPVYIKKAGLCRRCYMREYQRQRTGYYDRPRAEQGRDTAGYVKRQGRRVLPLLDLSGHGSYSSAHDRCRRRRGKPNEYLCAMCRQRPGRDWSLMPGRGRHVGVKEIMGRMTDVAWSMNPADYRPLCKSCHNKLDGTGGIKSQRLPLATR